MKSLTLIFSAFAMVFAMSGYTQFAEGADKKPVLMLHTCPLSGILGSVPDTGYGLTDAATYINETGGIGGRELVGVVEDGRYDVPTTLGIFNRFAESEPKDEFLSYSQFCTPCLKALTEKVNEEEKIPVLAGSMSALIFNDEEIKKTPYFFATGPGYGEQWGMVLKYIKLNHKKSTPPRVAFHYFDNSTGRDPMGDLEMYAKKFGVEIVLMEPFSPTAQSFATSFLKFRKEEIEYVLFWNWSLKIGVRYFKEAKKYLPKTPIFGVHWTAANLYFNFVGKDYDNHFVVSGYPVETELDNKFVKIITDMAKKKDRKVMAWAFYMQSWVMAQLPAEAARQVLREGKPLTRENLRYALENIDTDLLGMFGGEKLDYRTHKFSRARVLRADWSKKTLVPMTEWVDIYDYLK
ncbi:ABC transporter substrate-binding protein [bacterium]|nr:ABC transporter substrate-binding protein [bacterium]